MNALRPILLAGAGRSFGAPLIEALSSQGFEASAGDLAQAGLLLAEQHFERLVVAPSLDAGEPDSWGAVAEESTRIFELVQRFARNAIARKGSGHVLLLLSSASAMGDATDPGGSALTGGMLSLLRTLAIEFRKLALSVNAVLVEDDRTGVTALQAADVAALINSLVSQSSTAISGQAIHACNATDAGRLHP